MSRPVALTISTSGGDRQGANGILEQGSFPEGSGNSGNLGPWRAGAKDAGPRVGSRLGLVFGSGVVRGHFLEDG